MTFRVNMRWGHLDRMPKCAHGRVEGFCACWDAIAIEAAIAGETTEIGSTRSAKARAGTASPESPSR